jgi:hypothetical protein
MHDEPGIEFDAVARAFDARGVRWVLIGGQAVRLYGGPRVSYDYDVWVDPACRVEALTVLRDLGCELSAEPDDVQPIVSARAGADRIDVFAVRAMTNVEQTRIVFDAVWARARVERDEETRLDIRIPEIDDLIALKKMREGDPRDAEDVRWLLVRKRLGSA